MTVVELRQYVLHPGRRAELVELFDREFVEPQETHGLQVIGTFTDLDDPDRFVWFRGFPDMPARVAGLEAFYDGPVWQAHRQQANATMIDSDDVLLLRPVVPFAQGPAGLVEVSVFQLPQPAEAEFLAWFQERVEPVLIATGSPLLALLVTDPSANTFPRLPIREGEHVLVRLAGYSDDHSYEVHRGALAADPVWTGVEAQLRARSLSRQVLRLAPTPRSRLH
jgi:hypothetical protein